MSRRTWFVAGALVVVLLGVLAAWWWALNGDEPSPEDAFADEASDEELDEWVFDEPRDPVDTPSVPGSGGEAVGPPHRDGPEWEERRRRWRERWQRRVEIVPLGERDPGIDASAIRAALGPRRPALRACIGEAGGWRAFREARRSQIGAGEEEPRRRRGGRVFFDVQPDGTVDRSTLELRPPMPEPFSECFLDFFGGVELGDVGDGARVELPLGPGRRRGRFGDGGVPSGRWRGRGGERRPRSEDRPRGEDRMRGEDRPRGEPNRDTPE